MIIMYHGVRNGKNRINGRHISAEHFEKQLQYFVKEFDIVPLHQICGMKEQGIIPTKNTIALTFDDGFLNNVVVALPLLEKYQIPATFFICTASITDPIYAHPTDRIDLIRIFPQTSFIKIGTETFLRENHQLISRRDGKNAYTGIIMLSFQQWLRANNDLRDQLSQNIINENLELYQLVNDPSVATLSKSDLVTLGSHSHHHVNLTMLTAAEAGYQLEESKNILESYGKKIDTMAFPYGFYDQRTISLAKESGYNYLIAGGHVDPPFDKDVFPRIGVLDGAGLSYTLLMINKGFSRFGF